MKHKKKQELKKWLLRIGLGELIFSLYFAGVLNTLYSTNGATFSPIGIIKCMAEKGFPTGVFFVIFLILAVVTAFVFLNVWGNEDGSDPLGRKFTNAMERQVYGDSHFEEPEEYEDMAVIQSPQKSYGTILGMLDQTGKYLINLRHDDSRTNHHIMCVGASGSGKTFTFAKDYCLQTIRRKESIVVTDPDGGLTRDMATSFMNAGYCVRILNLKDLSLSDGWDCLKSVRNGKMIETTAQMFSHIVISNIMDAKTQSIYKDGPKSLLTALILRCLICKDVAEEDKNIRTVYNYLMHDDAAEFLDAMFDDQKIPVDEKACLRPYQAAKSASANLWGNLVTNLTIGLNLLQSEQVCNLLTTDDIDLLLPGQRPCAYFCQFPDSHDTFKFIVALFFSMLFINLVDFADSQDDGKLPVPVNFLMDECASIGIIPDFDRKLATIRKRDMAVAMIWQNVGQVYLNYGDRWETIISNCDTFLSLGVNDSQTADMITKRIGDTTVRVETQQHEGIEKSIMGALNKYSTGEGRRSLLSYDEVFKINRDECIIIFKGHNPVHAYKHPHTLHPDAKNMAKWFIRDKTPIEEKEQRKKERIEEKMQLAAYEREHPFKDIDRSYKGKFGSAWSDFDDEENGTSTRQRIADAWNVVRTKSAMLRDELDYRVSKIKDRSKSNDRSRKSDERARRIKRQRRAMSYEEQDWWPDERIPHGSGYEQWNTSQAEGDAVELDGEFVAPPEEPADVIEWETAPAAPESPPTPAETPPNDEMPPAEETPRPAPEKPKQKPQPELTPREEHHLPQRETKPDKAKDGAARAYAQGAPRGNLNLGSAPRANMPNMQNRPNSNSRNQQGNKNAGGQGTGFAGFQQGGKPVQDNKKKTEQAERTQPVRRPHPEKPFPTMGNSSLEALSKGSDKNKKKQSVCPPSKN
mgnify:FL=1